MNWRQHALLEPALAPAAPPRRRPWWWRYCFTLLVLLAALLHAAYLLLAQMRNPVPEPGQLSKIPIEVVQAQSHGPHLQVRLADGSLRSMEFPVPVTWWGQPYTALDEAEMQKLPGCMGYVQGVPVHWVRGERFRVWDLHCGPVHRDYAAFLASELATPRPALPLEEWQLWTLGSFTLLVLALEWFAQRRRARRAAA